MTDLPPMAKWMAAVIAGGGTASLTQGVTTILRAKSTVVTGGLGNPVIATGELGGSALLSLLALAAPLTAVAVVILLLWLAFRLIRRQRRGTQRADN
jgi:nitrate/nitrite transporter NarK